MHAVAELPPHLLYAYAQSHEQQQSASHVVVYHMRMAHNARWRQTRPKRIFQRCRVLHPKCHRIFAAMAKAQGRSRGTEAEVELRRLNTKIAVAI